MEILKKKRNIFIALAISAILTGLAVTAPKIFGIFEWVSMIPFAAALFALADNEELKLRKIYCYGLFFFELFYMVGFHFFIYLYPLDFTGLDNFSSILVIIVAWLGLPFIQALFGGFMFVVFAAFRRSALAKKVPILSVIALPLIYAAYEFTQTLGWWGVPWSRLPLGQIEILPFVSSASLFGSYFISAMLVAVNTLLYLAVKNIGELKKAGKIALLALGIFSANALIGTAVYFSTEAQMQKSESISIGVVQGNFSSTEHLSSSPYTVFSKHLQLTESCFSEGAKIVIWAETALPFGISEGDYYCERLASVAKINEAYILVGCMQHKDEGSFNSILCFTPDGEVSDTVYYKRHLVPFGEYVPMREIINVVLPFLSEIPILAGDMTPGEGAEIFNTEHGNIGSLICFDSIYEALVLDSVREGAQILAISTNDSWFSDSLGIYMHNSQARLRAIEVGRAVARSANTGVSSFITPSGRVLTEIAPLEDGYAVESLPLTSARTLYSYIGNTFVYLCFAFVLSAPVYSLVLFIRKRLNNSKGDIYDENR